MKNFKISLSPQVTLTEIDGKLVLFSKTSGDFFGLNESALFLLKLALETDFKSAVERAAGEYQESVDVIQEDLLALIEDLKKAKVLTTLPCE